MPDEKNDTAELSNLYQQYYHEDGVAPAVLASFRIFAGVLVRRYSPKRVIDFGCSGGALVRAMAELGVSAIGIDGSKHALDRTPGKIFQHDLRCKSGIPWEPASFDMATTTDTAEHIEPEYAETFSGLVAGAVAPGGVVAFGGAPPGQGGVHHVNCRRVFYWIDMLERHGLKLLAADTESVRDEIERDPAHATCWWVQQNVMMLRKVAP